jgi:predicted transposase YbfD/YdcC
MDEMVVKDRLCLPLKGALVTINAIATNATNATVAQAILDRDGDDVLALKRNQPTLHDDVVRYVEDPQTTGLETAETIDKDHGRIETRRTTVSHDVAWLQSDRRYPDEPRFPGLKTLVRTTTRTERLGKVTEETRYFISSTVLSPQRAADAIRGHWGIESMHWSLDVTFKEDQSRLRRGHGAQNMALVRRFAFNIIRAGRGRRSIKTTRKVAGWNPAVLAQLIAGPVH